MGTNNSLQYLFWLKSKTVKIYSVVQTVKLLLALSIFTCIWMKTVRKKIGGYDQEIPQSQISEKSMAYSEIKFGHKNTPPPKPYGSGLNVQ